MAESIENLHSISNFDINPTTKGKRKYTTIERSSVCGVLGDLAKRLPATCRITDRSDSRFRQFIVHEMSRKQRETKRAGNGEGVGGANQKIIHIELPQQPHSQNTHKFE